MNLQKNEREITPVDTWAGGVVRKMNVFKLESFSNYRFLEGGGMVNWSLIERMSFIDTETDKVSCIDYPTSSGDVPLPSELVATWGEDDEPIFLYVMERINVTPVGDQNSMS